MTPHYLAAQMCCCCRGDLILPNCSNALWSGMESQDEDMNGVSRLCWLQKSSTVYDNPSLDAPGEIGGICHICLVQDANLNLLRGYLLWHLPHLITISWVLAKKGVAGMSKKVCFFMNRKIMGWVMELESTWGFVNHFFLFPLWLPPLIK